MLARLIATVAALLLACASPQTDAYVRAERVSVSLADLAAIGRSGLADETAPPTKTASNLKTAPPARARPAEPAPGKNAALTHCHVGENWSPLQECASMPGVYQWDGTRLAGRTNATGSTLGDYQHAYGWAISSREGAIRSTLHTDVHGTPQLITDGTAAIAGWTRTDVWGVEKAQNGTQTRIGYTGYLKDPLLDELYAQARQYRPGSGRFTSVDPWEGDTNNPLSLNKYLYGLGNPGSFIDPDGRCAEPVTGVLCALGLAAAATATSEYVRLKLFGSENEQANAGAYAVANTAKATMVVGGGVLAVGAIAETGGAAAPLVMGLMQGGRAAGLVGAQAGFNTALVNTAPRAFAAVEGVALAGAGFAGAEVPSSLPGVPAARQLMSETAAELDARLLRMEPTLAGVADEIPAPPMGRATLQEGDAGNVALVSDSQQSLAGPTPGWNRYVQAESEIRQLASVKSDVTDRLQSHADFATNSVINDQQVLLSQLSPKRQAQYLRGSMQSALEGKAIEKLWRNSVRNDPYLVDYVSLGSKTKGPDFVFAGQLERFGWGDLTTQRSWMEHVNRNPSLGYQGSGTLIKTR